MKILLHLSEKAAGLSASYVTVDEVDALYAELQKAGAARDAGMEDSSYGMRDFNIATSTGRPLGSGQAIDRSEPR